MPAPTDTALAEVSACPTWAAASYSASSDNTQSIFSSTGPLNLVSAQSGYSPLADVPPSLIAPPQLRSSLLVQQQLAAARLNYVFGSTYSLMSTATLVPSSSADVETQRRSIVLSGMITPSHLPAPQHPVSQTQPPSSVSARTPKDDCESRHLHAAAERINQMLIEVTDRSIWTWEDITSSRFQQATLLTLRSPASRKTSTILLRSARFLDKFVKCVAGAFAEAEVGGRCEEATACLQCHHGLAHRHYEESDKEGCPQPACTITRFAQAAFNMGITCPNRHFAARSLQIYRALEAQLDEKSLSEVLVRIVESLSDANDEVQSYMVELLLTLEAAVEHIQLRGTVFSGKLYILFSHCVFDIIEGARSSTFVQPTAPESPLVYSKPPPTPPVHERRHSRRGSSSSLSSLFVLPNGGTTTGGTGIVGVGGVSSTSLPPIKRPLMPPHAEAVSEENESTTGPVSTGTGPIKPTSAKSPMPSLPPSVTKPSVLPISTPSTDAVLEVKQTSTDGCEIKFVYFRAFTRPSSC